MIVLSGLVLALPGCGGGAETVTTAIPSTSPRPAAPSNSAEKPRDHRLHAAGKKTAAAPNAAQAKAKKAVQKHRQSQASNLKQKATEKEGDESLRPEPPGCPPALSASECQDLAQQIDTRPAQTHGSGSHGNCPDTADPTICSAAQAAQQQGEAKGKAEVAGECPPSLPPATCRELEEAR
jgi:hypothetical protein